MLTMTSDAVQSGFDKVIDLAQNEAVSITLHGRTAAFLVSPHDMEELLDARQRRSRAVAELEAWSDAASRHTSTEQATEAATLTDEETVRIVHELR
jgi:hypothetical protein